MLTRFMAQHGHILYCTLLAGLCSCTIIVKMLLPSSICQGAWQSGNFGIIKWDYALLHVRSGKELRITGRFLIVGDLWHKERRTERGPLRTWATGKGNGRNSEYPFGSRTEDWLSLVDDCVGTFRSVSKTDGEITKMSFR